MIRFFIPNGRVIDSTAMPLDTVIELIVTAARAHAVAAGESPPVRSG